MTSLGTPRGVAVVFPSILEQNCLIIIIDIIRCSYLILCYLPYNMFKLNEISIIYRNLFSNTVEYHNMS